MKIDLITGLLGSGKTTFICQYAKRLMDDGMKIAILASDYGAISVDRAFLTEALGETCEIEMITAADPDCFRRRFKTKLIAMGMSGYDRVIVEPSGVFDADEFFDLLYESPLDRWYSIGSVISIVDARLFALSAGDHTEAENEGNVSEGDVPEGDVSDGNSRRDLSGLTNEQEYLLASETACAGKIVLSRLQEVVNSTTQDDAKRCEDGISEPCASAGEDVHGRLDADRISVETDRLRARVAEGLSLSQEHFHGDRVFMKCQVLAEVWNGGMSDELYRKVKNAEYVRASVMKIPVAEEGNYQTLFYYRIERPKAITAGIIEDLFDEPEHYGHVMRVKGFFHDPETDEWLFVNAVGRNAEFQPTTVRKECLLVIGTGLSAGGVGAAFGELRRVTDYDIM